jgi:hypothetical protein
MMGLTRFRQRELAKTATRKAMDVIQAKSVNANANTFKRIELDIALNDEQFALAA